MSLLREVASKCLSCGHECGCLGRSRGLAEPLSQAPWLCLSPAPTAPHERGQPASSLFSSPSQV